MNASRPHFPIAVRSAAPLALAAGCVMLNGCIGNPFKDTAVDPASPVAADVARLTREQAKFPSFANIPAPPTDIRPPAQYGGDARQVLAAGEALMRETAPSRWTLQATEAFANEARRDAGPQLDPPKPGDAEAFAKELRERATPPPPRP